MADTPGKYDFIKSVPGHDGYFTTEQKRLVNIIGIDKFLELTDEFGGAEMHFSRSRIIKLQKMWLRNNTDVPIAAAAQTLGVTDRTVYKWRAEMDKHKKSRGVLTGWFKRVIF